MWSWTARLLLLAWLGGPLAPWVKGFSGQNPHACCLRRLHASANSPSSLNEPVRPDGNCCPPMASLQFGSAETSYSVQNVARVWFQERMVRESRISSFFRTTDLSRAPPSLA